MGENKIATPSALGSGYAVHASTKNPERTLMMLDLFHSNPEYIDMLVLGIPGVHWEAVGENKYKSLPAAAGKFDPYGSCPWHNINGKYERSDENTPDSVMTMKNNWASRVTWLKTDGFVFDDTNVKTEQAAISNIMSTYAVAIDTGLAGDPVKAVETLNAKLKEAGVDALIQEAQVQLDKYIAANQ
jgi:putative aldouronate transport system substrate-binding protein